MQAQVSGLLPGDFWSGNKVLSLWPQWSDIRSDRWVARFSGAIEGAIVASLETGFNGYNQSVGAQAPHA
ncbi:MAG: hypothetical protein OQL27_13665, partial [Sedimenticola sp.]|nr:hypothetical protein [Sedimenticola sp.]